MLKNNLHITRNLFIETINEIKKQYDHDNKCYEAYKVIFADDYVSGYDNHWIQNQLIKLLKVALNDDHKDSWIEYFLYELDFGKKYKRGCATDVDGTIINISDAGHLYDYLTK